METARDSVKRVLVVGCGFVGEAAADLFHARGWAVVGWTHSPESAARLSAEKPYPVSACDITNAESVRAAARELPGGGKMDVVVDCVSSGRGGGVEQYRRVYFDGARHLTAAVPASRFVYTGSTSVYAQVDGEAVDEASPALPDRGTGRVLLETEAVILAAPGGVVARLAGIYGPGRSVLLKKFLAGEATVEGEGGRWLNQIQRDDAAGALYRLAQPDAPPGVYNVADGTPLTQAELYRGLAEQFGRAMPPGGPEDRNRKRGWTSKRVSNANMRGLGWEPRYPSFLDWAAEQAENTVA